MGAHHSMNRICDAMSVGRYGELTAIVCSTASSGSSVCSIDLTTICASGAWMM